MSVLDKQTVEELYTWIDSIPLTRPKRDFKRDFSDGVLIAEVVKSFFPHFVDLHNYTSAQAICKKIGNWQLLNSHVPHPKEDTSCKLKAIEARYEQYFALYDLKERKVFRRFGFEVSEDIINNIVSCKPSTIEQFLLLLKQRMTNMKLEHNSLTSKPSNASDDQSTKIKPDDAGNTALDDSNRNVGDWLSGDVIDVHDTSPRDNDSSKAPVRPTGVRLQSSLGDCKTSSVIKSSSRAGSQSEEIAQLTAYEQDKDETIKLLEAKIKRLERLLSVRDVRYADLRGRYSRLEKRLKLASATAEVTSS